MKRLATAPNLAIATLWADLLREAGIRVSLQRVFASGLAGQIPPDQALPEIWLDDEAQRPAALSLLHELGDPDAEYAVGDVVQFPTPDGQGKFAGVVHAVGEGWLEFDFNHPLAGQQVTFEVHVIGVL